MNEKNFTSNPYESNSSKEVLKEIVGHVGVVYDEVKLERRLRKIEEAQSKHEENDVPEESDEKVAAEAEERDTEKLEKIRNIIEEK